MKEIPIRSLGDFAKAINDLARPHKAHLHLRLWFRGVPDAAFDLKPAVYRGTPHANLLSDERHAYRDFRLWSAGIVPPTTTPEDLYFQQQHHGLPSRLLDWTTNAMAALYFAAQKYPYKQAAVYAMDAYELGEHKFIGFDGKEYSAGGFAVPGANPNGLIRVALAEIVHWMYDVPQPNFVFPVRPAFTDVRMQIQRSCFTYHPPSRQVLTGELNKSLCKLVLSVAAKREINEQLLHLGMDDFSVFGDVDSLARTVRDNYGWDE